MLRGKNRRKRPWLIAITRIWVTLLSLSLTLQGWGAVVAAAPDLADVPGHWAEAEVNALLSQGVIRGYEDGTFRPNAPITRAEFVTMLNRAAGAQASGETAAFADVTAGDWFAADVALAAASGVVNGFEDGTFRPKQSVTRQEVAVILARALELQAAPDAPFADSGDIPAWAGPAVAAAAAAGYLKGYPDGTFGGARSITRAEAAVLLERTRLRLVTSMPRSVAVSVTDETSAPLAGAAVRVHRPGEREVLAGATTAASGTATFHLRPGEYAITAVAGQRAGFITDKVLPGVTALSLKVAAAATLTGTVGDGSGQPLVGALVALTTNPTFLTQTGADGRFVAVVPPGRDYQVAVAAPGSGTFRPIEPPVTAPAAGQSKDLGHVDLKTGRRTEPTDPTAPPEEKPPGNPPPNNPPPGNPPPGNPGNGGGGGGPAAPTLQGLTLSPAGVQLGVDESVTLTVTASYSDGSARDYSSAVTFTSGNPAVAAVDATGKVTGRSEGETTLVASAEGRTATATVRVFSLVGPELEPTTASDLQASTAFLYTGANPVQKGVAPGTMAEQRVAVLRGKVTTRDGEPLPGVKVTVLDHPEFGETLTRSDGMFDMAVNGGGQLTLTYEKSGFLPSQRDVTAPWQDYAWLPVVALIQVDSRVTTVDLNAATEIQVAQGNPVVDDAGERQATVMFKPGTAAKMVMPDGQVVSLDTLNVRATEYTVGEGGPAAMPGELPATSGYTYAVELSVDEALAAGATEVRFDQPVINYVENFHGFPVGEAVPTGYYDRQLGQWVAAPNGRVIAVVGETAGLAQVDTDGDGLADTAEQLAVLGIDDDELAKLAALYEPGQSLWRVPITHFTPWDHNWPYGPPEDAESPDGRPLRRGPNDRKCTSGGSIIECQNQVLGEALPVTGTPFALHYQSDRTPGGSIEAYSLDIPITGATYPNSLKYVLVEIKVAGKQFSQYFRPSPNQTYTFTWNGLDAYGRRVLGEQRAVVRVGYAYQAQYYPSNSAFQQSFSIPTNRPYSLGRVMFEDIVLWSTWTEFIGGWDAKAAGLGGWSLDVHHAFSPAAQTLYLGNGQMRHLGTLNAITRVAGNGQSGQDTIGDGGLAIEATVENPMGIAVAPDGSIYVTEPYKGRVRRVAPDGKIYSIVATPGFASPTGIAVGPDGSLYVAEKDDHRVRRIAPDGSVTTVAGTGIQGSSGDGGLATAARLNSPRAVAVGPDGSLYIAEAARIRRVGPDGRIATIAGNGGFEFNGDSIPAVNAAIGYVYGLAVGPDGSVYLAAADHSRIRRVGPDGIITTVVGTGQRGYSGDGGPGAQATLNWATGVAVGPDGSLYIADAGNQRIRRLGPSGVITTVAGTGEPGFSGDGGAAAAAKLSSPFAVSSAPDGSIYIADSSNHMIRQVKILMAASQAGATLLPSEDGREVYAFDENGRHLKTLDALTGSVRYSFYYTPGGALSRVEDGYGNATLIERNQAGDPVAIVAPGGQRTSLTVGPDGYLSSVANPAGEAVRLTYREGGVLDTYRSSGGGLWRFTFDERGRLLRDEDPVGGFKTLEQNKIANGTEVILATAEGKQTKFRVESLPDGRVRRTQIEPSGASRSVVIDTDGTQTVTGSDGVVATLVTGPDPRWGMLVPVPSSVTFTTPDGMESRLERRREVEMAPNSADIFDIISVTETVVTNGEEWVVKYDAATSTVTSTSPEGRVSQVVLDGKGRVVRRLHDVDSGVAPVLYSYDSRGRLRGLAQGSTSWTYGYDDKNRLVARTDSADRITRYTYDDADRLIRTELPNGEVVRFEYDADGNPLRMIMPNGEVHQFGYTSVGLNTTYAPPGNAAFTTYYNRDRVRTRYDLPDGRRQEFAYDEGGRPKAVTYAEAAVGYQYSDLSERLSVLTWTPTAGSGAQQIAYTYDGDLVKSMTYTGAAQGAYTYRYDKFFLAGITLDGGLETALSWDADGRLIGHGPFTITRNGPDGSPSQITDGALTVDYSYYQIKNDSGAPTWPAGNSLSATRVTTSSITLSWSAAVDDTRVAGYEIYQDGQRLAVVTNGRTYTVDGLPDGVEYNFQVKAGDAAGNWSTDGPKLSVSTMVDVAPSWPEGSKLEATGVAHKRLTLTWSSAADDVGVTGYQVYQGAALLATLGQPLVTTYEVTGLSPDTEYTFRVEAGDKKGQWSTTGPTLTVRTIPDLTPTWPAGASLTVSNLTPTSLSVGWTEATDDLELAEYRIYVDGSHRLTVDATKRAVELSGFAPGRSYTLKVEACDTGAHCTADGPSATATTPVGGGIDGESTLVRASLSSAGAEGTANSEYPAVSADGNLIVFSSESALAPEDTNNFCGYSRNANCADIYVLDRSTGVLQRISVAEDGSQLSQSSGANGLDISDDGRHVVYTAGPYNYGAGGGYGSIGLWAYDRQTATTVRLGSFDARDPSISGNGRIVAYEKANYYGISVEILDRDADGNGIYDEPEGTRTIQVAGASDARTSGDGNWVVYTRKVPRYQVYAYHVPTGTETLVSTDADGTMATSDQFFPDVSRDGRFVIFNTWSDNLGGDGAVILHDRDTDEDSIYDEAGAISNRRVDVATGGTPANTDALRWRISGTGRYVLFMSEADNLVPDDTNGLTDYFLHDTGSGQTIRVNVSGTGAQADDDASEDDGFDVSDDGETVVFASFATNLTAADTNNSSDIFFTQWLPRQAPTWPDGSSLTATDVTLTSLTLTWSAAQDNVAVTRYDLYRGTTLLTTLDAATLTYGVTGLEPGTGYTFRVVARDAAGNASENGPSVTVTTVPDVTAPALVSSRVNGSLLELSYSEPLDEGSVPSPADFAVTVNGTEQGAPTAVTVLKTKVSMTLVAPVGAGDTVALDYTVGSRPVRDRYGNAAANLAAQAVTNVTGLDNAAPQLESATARDYQIVLSYDEELDSTSVPDATDFTVTFSVEGSERTVTVTSVEVYGQDVLLNLESRARIWYDITLSYTAGANPIRDLYGNPADDLFDTVVGFGFSEGPTLNRLMAPVDPPADTSGRLNTRTHAVNGQAAYELNLSYDGMGRIIGRTETVAGTTTTYAYTYDDIGQLLTVTRDGELAERYGYDKNGNRTSRAIGGAPAETAVYDAQDRLLSLGNVAYQFDVAGFLAKRGGDTFQYSTRGELLQVTMAGGQVVRYSYDGLGRRVSRTEGSSTYQYLYGNPNNPFEVTEIRDPQGGLTTLFHDDAGILYAMRRDGAYYYVGADQVGTPRIVTDASGATVKVLTYDSFGNLLSDSNPAFDLPIGFAGGLADRVTGLVRFGFRDYDPAAGRWTARDPVLFQGGQTNLYVYVANNPISLHDPTGLFCVGGSAYVKFGGGGKVCFDDEGFSLCAEVGFGIGMGYEVDPFGGLDQDGTKIKAEAKCQAGPVGAGMGGSFDECGFKAEGKLCGGPLCFKANSDGDIGGQVENFEFGLGCEAKVAGEACMQIKSGPN